MESKIASKIVRGRNGSTPADHPKGTTADPGSIPGASTTPPTEAQKARLTYGANLDPETPEEWLREAIRLLRTQIVL